MNLLHSERTARSELSFRLFRLTAMFFGCGLGVTSALAAERLPQKFALGAEREHASFSAEQLDDERALLGDGEGAGLGGGGERFLRPLPWSTEPVAFRPRGASLGLASAPGSLSLGSPNPLENLSAASFILIPRGNYNYTSSVGAPHQASLWVPIAHSLGLMTGMRLAEAYIWPEPFANTSSAVWWKNYRRAFSEPPLWDSSARAFEWDGDPWWINAIGHGLFGSELHLRARQCQRSVLEALAFSTIASAVWEYAFEANEVHPSGLDLWYTPASGLLIGEFRYWVWNIAQGAAPGWRRVFSVAMDPLGEFERALGTPC